MDFVSWLVVAVLFMLAEFGVGAFYLFATGVACIYASFASFNGASGSTQMAVLAAGILIHFSALLLVKKFNSSKTPAPIPADIGQRVEVIEWYDECTANVRYLGREWQADKAESEMPDAAWGRIQSVHGNRLIITTE